MKATINDLVPKSKWDVKRTKPYTEIGISRLTCIRCGKKAQFQWQICSDGNVFRPICVECDIELNRLVLDFFNHPDIDGLMKAYELEKRGE